MPDKLAPYTLNIKKAAEHFGLAAHTLYNWVSNGRLIRGVHYMKVGGKPLIIREKFIEWMEEQDGSWQTWGKAGH